MKNLIALVTLLINVSAFATVIDFPEMPRPDFPPRRPVPGVEKPGQITKDIQHIAYVSHAEVVSADQYYPPCPPNAMCMPMAKVRVKFTLGGCFDRLGPVAHTTSYDHRTGKTNLIVAAINKMSKNSLVAFCFAPSVQFKELTIPSYSFDKEDINLVLLK